MGNEGINKFAQMLDGRSRTINEKPPAFDLGTMQSDLSLKLRMFPITIPPSDYLVCQAVNAGIGLVGGDTVLCAWVGRDVVIIDRISTIDEEV